MSLQRLLIRDFVLVKSMEIDFGKGFTALTGETGAGKSILIDALQLALGERSNATYIREGASNAEIALEADVTPAVQCWFERSGFEPQADSPASVLMKRTVDRNGKSRAWINGSAATTAQLRELGGLLVDIYGQHAWTALTHERGSRLLFDAYAGVDLNALDRAWETLQSCKRAIKTAQGQAETHRAERLRLEWQIAELSKLDPDPHEWLELNTEHDRLSHSSVLLDACNHSLALVEGGDSEEEENLGAHALKQVLSAVHRLESYRGLEPEFEAVCSTLNEGVVLLEAAAQQLHGLLRRLQPDPTRLAVLDERLSTWISLSKRFGFSPEHLFETLQGWKEKLSSLETVTDLAQLEKALSSAQAEFDAVVKTASAQRAKASLAFSKSVTSLIRTLGMEGGVFHVQLTPLQAPQSHGAESVSFLLAGHSGSTPKPVDKVASGGELSRLALAVAVAGSKDTLTPTLIFDEIDSGIGGTTALAVGQLMRQLSQSRQVLAVTHLAQVAGFAHNHGIVHKKVGKPSSTLPVSSVGFVEGEAREREIARMLGSGETPTPAALQHARELLSSV